MSALITMEGSSVVKLIKTPTKIPLHSAVYAPNPDTPSFFDALLQRLMDYSAHKILIGDFNLVMDPVIDRHKSITNCHNVK